MSACGLARCQPRGQWSSTERRFKVELLHWKFMDRLLGVSLQTLILWSQSLSHWRCIIVHMTWPSCWNMYVLIITHHNQWHIVTSPSKTIVVHNLYTFTGRRTPLEYCPWFGTKNHEVSHQIWPCSMLVEHLHAVCTKKQDPSGYPWSITIEWCSYLLRLASRTLAEVLHDKYGVS